ncbi:hypothetical protein [Streptomyces chrestomyceticus]|uniref:hypothetical protein n=1 Tax=Streptomyces chrestomyceticus TaxID=68185 RepID=UPI0019D0AF83|nr:hypothetical protein [Streptomyces chrestomyceticus]
MSCEVAGHFGASPHPARRSGTTGATPAAASGKAPAAPSAARTTFGPATATRSGLFPTLHVVLTGLPERLLQRRLEALARDVEAVTIAVLATTLPRLKRGYGQGQG